MIQKLIDFIFESGLRTGLVIGAVGTAIVGLGADDPPSSTFGALLIILGVVIILITSIIFKLFGV